MKPTSLFLGLVALVVISGCGGAQTQPAAPVPTSTVVAPPTEAPTSKPPAPTNTVPLRPPTETAVAPSPTEAASNESLFVPGTPQMSVSGVSTDLTVFGTVQYTGKTPRVDPNITVTLFDDAGKVLATENAFTVPSYIRPGSTIPYSVLISNPPAKWSKVTVETTADEMDNMVGSFIYGDLEVTQSSIVPGKDYNPTNVVGQVKNTGSKKASLVSVVGALYDESGKLLGVESGEVKQSSLAPGQTGTFEISFYEQGAAKGSKADLYASGTPEQ